jgi:hypothetical protein
VVSRTENVNPFMVSEYFGSITLSPQSDEWKVDQHAAAKIIDGGTRLKTNQAVMFDQSEWGWLGNDIEGLEVGDATRVAGTTTSSSRSFTQRAGNLTVWGFDQTTSSIVNRVVASETIRTSLGDRIIDVAVIPFMRSRKVSFEAIGLRPNAYHFAYLNNVKMDDFVRSTGNFDRINSARVEFESPNNLTTHPDGAGALLSDAPAPSGFLVDNFKDLFHSNTNSVEYRASVNPKTVLLFPLPSTTSKAFVSSSNKLSDTVSSSKSTRLSILPISFMV